MKKRIIKILIPEYFNTRLKSIYKLILKKVKYRRFLKKKCFIIMVDGGLASQINKYFIGEFIKKNLNVRVKYDISWFKTYGKCVDGINPRSFELLNLLPNIDFTIAETEEIDFYKNNFYYYNKNVHIYNEALLTFKAPCYIDGYMFHWKYYNNTLSNIINEESIIDKVNASKLELIKSTKNSVAIHVRRGDFLSAVQGALDERYFLKAIDYAYNSLTIKGLKFFIFSNDIQWVKNNLVNKISQDITYHIMPQDSEGNPISDFYLMSKCGHQICSNSGYSYLASFFNQNKTKLVIVPEKWILNDNIDHNINLENIDALHPNYIKIKI